MVILAFFILSVIFLLNFDKVNVVKVGNEPAYLKAKEHLHTVEHPLKLNQAEVDYYAYKLDTLTQHQAAVAKDKKAVKALQEDIDRTKKTLGEKKEALAQTEQAIADERAAFEPIEAEYNDMVAQTEAAEGTYNVFLFITLLLFLVKVLIWAIWNYKNSLNLRNVCPWMEKATAPSWAFWGWIIPIYNLIKPYAFFNELYDETEYALTDKNVMRGQHTVGNLYGLGPVSVDIVVVSDIVFAFMVFGLFFHPDIISWVGNQFGVVSVSILCQDNILVIISLLFVTALAIVEI